jgi:hypothetical protein
VSLGGTKHQTNKITCRNERIKKHSTNNTKHSKYKHTHSQQVHILHQIDTYIFDVISVPVVNIYIYI